MSQTAKTSSFHLDSEDADHPDGNLRRVLAALPRLLRRPVLRARPRLVPRHPARLPRVLLAGNVTRHRLPSRLLLHESNVRIYVLERFFFKLFQCIICTTPCQRSLNI